MQKNLRVTLMDISGSDKSFCLAAWQSTFRELDIEIPDNVEDRTKAMFDAICKTKKKTPQELISMLAKEGHHPPFEFCYLQFNIVADIATHIHCLKHRIGISINTESARYKELEDKHYIPNDWDSYTSQSYGANRVKIQLQNHTLQGEKLYHYAINELQNKEGLTRKRAKETARYFLGYNKMLNFTMAFNMRSFMHFQRLRNSPNAQLEIRTIAQMMLEQVRETNRFPLTLKAFGYE